jgi:hypothetical protein
MEETLRIDGSNGIHLLRRGQPQAAGYNSAQSLRPLRNSMLASSRLPILRFNNTIVQLFQLSASGLMG